MCCTSEVRSLHTVDVFNWLPVSRLSRWAVSAKRRLKSGPPAMRRFHAGDGVEPLMTPARSYAPFRDFSHSATPVVLPKALKGMAIVEFDKLKCVVAPVGPARPQQLAPIINGTGVT